MKRKEPMIQDIDNLITTDIKEATQTVEDELKLEDAGWINLSATGGDVITEGERITNLKTSRLYYAKDPLGKQSIRLWTDYTFGTGMTWSAKDKTAQEILTKFWDNRQNRSVLSARGQRQSSDKLLVDGEVFFALFLGAGGEAKIRLIDPLEITQIITDVDDETDVLYYKREWWDSTHQGKQAYYRSTSNIKGVTGMDSKGSVCLLYTSPSPRDRS